MSTIGEITQRIQSLYSKGVHSDDTRLSSRHIYSVMKSIKARLIYQKISKKRRLSEWYYKTLTCVEIEEVPLQECIDLGCNDLGCTVKRTVCQLPEPIFGKEEHQVMFVTTIDNSIEIKPVTIEKIKYLLNNKYTGSIPGRYWQNKRMYFVNLPEHITQVKITGVWKDEVDLLTFCKDLSSEEVDCKSVLDMEFTIDAELEDLVVQLAIKELVVMFSAAKDDKTNNANDDNKGNI